MLVKPITFGCTAHGAHARYSLPQELTQTKCCRQRRGVARSSCVTAAKVRRVTLNFETSEGKTQVDCDSGDILRDVMLENKVDLYTTWGKIWTCGGNGQCGTCVVEVVDGQKLLSEKNDTEQKKLKRKPATYRLACQTNVGDGTNQGTINLKTKPS